MSISPTCSKCGKELTDYGAIVLSPPDKENRVVKFHVCKACYEIIAKDLNK